ncbi:hypothetical protein K438DRAFT_1853697 [Mycena galopus ATCC 62051]|nr:hypothetical protein K438DRAFT_1853697 [Mycena galopus ATCC 62051]
MAPEIFVIDLPPEITSVIFMLCVLDEYDAEWHKPGLSTFAEYSAPLLFGRICRQWRNVAWSTPEFWTALQVQCPYSIEVVVPHLDRWLLRAGPLPVTLDIEYRTHPDTSSDGLRQLLQCHSRQLQDLTLNINPAYDLFRFNELGPLRALKKIFLTCASLQYYQGMITDFREAPELRDVQSEVSRMITETSLQPFES